MKTNPSAPDRPSPPSRFRSAFKRNYGRIALFLLLVWCFLPAVMSVAFVVLGALGKYPSAAEREALGMVRGFYNNAIAVRSYQNMFYILGAVTFLFSLFCLLLCRKRVFSMRSVRKMPWFFFLALLLFWSVLSTLSSDDLLYAVVGQYYFRDGFLSYLIFAALFVCASLIQREADRKLILRVFVLVVCYLAAIMLVQELAGNTFIDDCFPAVRAVVFNQFNHFGYILSMGAVGAFCLYLFDREAGRIVHFLYLAGVFYLLGALLLNNTFGAQLAVAAALPVVYLCSLAAGRRADKRVLVVLAMVLLLGVILYFLLVPGKSALFKNVAQLRTDIVKILNGSEDAGQAGTGRFLLWKETVRRIAERPLLGFGPDGFAGKNALPNGRMPHNEYLQIAGFLGIPALVFYLCALFTLAIHHLRHIRSLAPMVAAVSGVALVYLVSALFGNPVYNTAPYLWLFLGLSASLGEAEAPALFSVEESSERDFKQAGLVLALSLVAAAVLFALGWNSRQTETRNELEDLEAMRNAATIARELLDPAALPADTTTYYWYLKNGETISPVYTGAPAPYGMGSISAGSGLAEFREKYGYVYQYDDRSDYTDKVLMVAASADPSGELNLMLGWIEPKQ